MNLSVKENVVGPCEFQYYRDNSLWYKTCTGLQFPVPVSDIDQGTFNASEKGMLMMRWIRKHIAHLEKEMSL
jgi:hypothetical protein